MSKTRLWCFTNYDLEFDYEAYYRKSTATYIGYAEEVCPSTERLHHQGFIYFSGARGSKKQVGKELGGAHVDMCKGTIDQNVDYCSKEGRLIEIGEKPDQGKRTDLLEIKRSMDAGLKAEEILMDRPEVYHQYGRTLNKIEDVLLRRKFRTEMTSGVWYFGETGVGKSHRAFQGFSTDTHYVFPNDGGWWDGYIGQEVVIINEFRGSIAYGELLDLVDKWPKTVKRRNREPVPFLAKKVIITSSLPPEGVFHALAEKDSLAQIYRRFEVIRICAKNLEQKWSGGNTEPPPDVPIKGIQSMSG